MADSTHRVEVVPVTLEKHPNADALSIVRIEGYQAVVRTEDWKHVEPCAYSYKVIPAIYPPPKCECGRPLLGAYVPPDSLVPVDRLEFAFLAEKHPGKVKVRVKAIRLRGEWSMGMLVPAPEGAQIGDDVATLLGVEHYDPPEPVSTSGETERPPKMQRRKCVSCEGTGRVMDPHHGMGFDCEACGGKGYPNDAMAESGEINVTYPKYDVEAFRKYGRRVFQPGEPVWVTEKIHGTNARFVFDGERFYCGSHKEWKRESDTNLWWKVLRQYPVLTNFLFMNPGTAVYGEVFGQVQDLKYGTAKGELRLAVFDILHNGKWVDAVTASECQPNPEGPPAWTLPWVPVVARGFPFDFEKLLALAEGPSLVAGADHFREGIVVKPLRERWDGKCGRINLKIVSNAYLSKAT